jgi:hypothetical protein
MRIILDGKKVGNQHSACYLKNNAYFTKKGLVKRIILHELYYHLAEKKGLEMSIREEEKGANSYSRAFLRNFLEVYRSVCN